MHSTTTHLINAVGATNRVMLTRIVDATISTVLGSVPLKLKPRSKGQLTELESYLKIVVVLIPSFRGLHELNALHGHDGDLLCALEC